MIRESSFSYHCMLTYLRPYGDLINLHTWFGFEGWTPGGTVMYISLFHVIHYVGMHYLHQDDLDSSYDLMLELKQVWLWRVWQLVYKYLSSPISLSGYILWQLTLPLISLFFIWLVFDLIYPYSTYWFNIINQFPSASFIKSIKLDSNI